MSAAKSLSIAAGPSSLTLIAKYNKSAAELLLSNHLSQYFKLLIISLMCKKLAELPSLIVIRGGILEFLLEP